MSDRPVADPKQVLINLVASIVALADHLGDAKSDCDVALKQIGLVMPDYVEDDETLVSWLAKDHGATSMYGTSLSDD